MQDGPPFLGPTIAGLQIPPPPSTASSPKAFHPISRKNHAAMLGDTTSRDASDIHFPSTPTLVHALLVTYVMTIGERPISHEWLHVRFK